MKFLTLYLSLCFFFTFAYLNGCKTNMEPAGKSIVKIADHASADLSDLSTEQIENAKSKLHIAYGHTSHGSQITTGMQGLVNFKGMLFAFNNGGSDAR